MVQHHPPLFSLELNKKKLINSRSLGALFVIKWLPYLIFGYRELYDGLKGAMEQGANCQGESKTLSVLRDKYKRLL